MKKTLKRVIFTLGLLFTISLGFSQDDALFKNVRSALKVGSSRELAKYFNETIELNTGQNFCSLLKHVKMAVVENNITQ